jgi:hypothetical protein
MLGVWLSWGKCGMIAHLTISFAIITGQPADNVELHGVSPLAMVDEASKTLGKQFMC